MDLQKAYDSIWRNALKGKVEKIGTDEKFLDIIYTMYKELNVSLFYIILLRTIFFSLFKSDLLSLLTDTNNINNKTPKLRGQKYRFINFCGRFSNFFTFTKITTEEN